MRNRGLASSISIGLLCCPQHRQASNEFHDLPRKCCLQTPRTQCSGRLHIPKPDRTRLNIHKISAFDEVLSSIRPLPHPDGFAGFWRNYKPPRSLTVINQMELSRRSLAESSEYCAIFYTVHKHISNSNRIELCKASDEMKYI